VISIFLRRPIGVVHPTSRTHPANRGNHGGAFSEPTIDQLEWVSIEFDLESLATKSTDQILRIHWHQLTNWTRKSLASAYLTAADFGSRGTSCQDAISDTIACKFIHWGAFCRYLDCTDGEKKTGQIGTAKCAMFEPARAGREIRAECWFSNRKDIGAEN
jgi:hypothetical protein